MAVTAPIWKDTFYTSSAQSLTYYILLDGAVIYAGKAFRMPSESTLRININKICENYLSTDIDAILGGSPSQTNIYAYRSFVLKDADNNELQTYNFLYNWSYEDWDGSPTTLSAPINSHYADGMLKLGTVIDNSGVVTFSSSASYFTEVDCAEYALYYTNVYGGWDSFLIEGNTVKKDNITQYTTNMSFDNTTLEFENDRFVSEIETSYVMNTDWLSDAQSERLARNLLGSNKVYIHNLKDGTIKPALITDSNIIYQTYKTNGNKMNQYQINIKESQTKIRR